MIVITVKCAVTSPLVLLVAKSAHRVRIVVIMFKWHGNKTLYLNPTNQLERTIIVIMGELSRKLH